MSETAAYDPIVTADENELSVGARGLWPEPTDDPALDGLVDLVEELPEPMRSVVEMRVWQRATFEEIAGTLDIKGGRGAASVYWARALMRLKEGFE